MIAAAPAGLICPRASRMLSVVSTKVRALVLIVAVSTIAVGCGPSLPMSCETLVTMELPSPEGLLASVV